MTGPQGECRPVVYGPGHRSGGVRYTAALQDEAGDVWTIECGHLHQSIRTAERCMNKVARAWAELRTQERAEVGPRTRPGEPLGSRYSVVEFRQETGPGRWTTRRATRLADSRPEAAADVVLPTPAADERDYANLADELNDGSPDQLTLEDFAADFVFAARIHARRAELPWPPATGDYDRYCEAKWAQDRRETLAARR